MKSDTKKNLKGSISVRFRSHVSQLRFNRAEAGGALGDLGTFIPLLVGMVNRCGLQLGPALFCAGLMNVVTGLVFCIPMPVQPMKAIAAVAIAEGMTESQIITAGLITAAVILLLAIVGVIGWLSKAIPKSVIRGLQVALGVGLLAKGLTMIVGTDTLFGWDSIAVGALCVALVLILHRSTRLPGALVVFVLGLVTLMYSQPTVLEQAQVGMTWHMPNLSIAGDWFTGLWEGAIPQIPLTLLNSVVAVCALSLDLFPDRPAPPWRVGMSVALMNLICCPFGAMPMCHGAGGLAAHYRFGARTGGSVIMLGMAMMALAVFFGGSLFVWLQLYPKSVLGVLLLFSGTELALMGRDQKLPANFFVMVLTAGVCIVVNTAIGFVVGWVIGALLTWYLVRGSASSSGVSRH